jgi:hypothetical protein
MLSFDLTYLPKRQGGDVMGRFLDPLGQEDDQEDQGDRQQDADDEIDHQAACSSSETTIV